MADRFGSTIAALYTSVHPQGYADAERLQILANAGFPRVDYHFAVEYDERRLRMVPFLQDDWQKWSASLKEEAKKLGVIIHQTHSPTPPLFESKECEKEAARIIDQAIEASALMGAQMMVVHPDTPSASRFDPQVCLELNAVFFAERAKTASRFGIRLCMENMLSNRLFDGTCFVRFCDKFDEQKELVEAIGQPNMGYCLDVGHAHYMHWDIPQTVRQMSDQLWALHVHDNDRFNDEHLAPFAGTLDWSGFLRALKEIGYQGTLTLETVNYCRRMPKELHPEALKMLAQVCRRMCDEAGI